MKPEDIGNLLRISLMVPLSNLFDTKRIRHFAISMESGYYSNFGNSRPKEFHEKMQKDNLLNWVTKIHKELHDVLPAELQTFNLIFDATPQTQEPSQYFTFRPARNFNKVDPSTSGVLSWLQDKVNKVLFESHERRKSVVSDDLGGSGCHCWKESSLKLRMGTIVRDRVDGRTTNEPVSCAVRCPLP